MMGPFQMQVVLVPVCAAHRTGTQNMIHLISSGHVIRLQSAVWVPPIFARKILQVMNQLSLQSGVIHRRTDVTRRYQIYTLIRRSRPARSNGRVKRVATCRKMDRWVITTKTVMSKFSDKFFRCFYSRAPSDIIEYVSLPTNLPSLGTISAVPSLS